MHMDAPHITLDFETTDFDSDRTLLNKLLNDYQKKYRPEPEGQNQQDAHRIEATQGDLPSLFELTPPRFVGGWYFSKLQIADQLVSLIYGVHSIEIDKIDSKKAARSVRGKQYQGDESMIRFAFWLNKKLNDMGGNAQVKIGEEMANFGYGVAQSIFGLGFGRLVDHKFGKT